MRNRAVIILASLSTLCIGGAAHAKGVVCERVQEDMFEVDGMSDDWQSFKPTHFGSGSDAAVELRCAYDAKKLYVALTANDERIVRTKKGRAMSEDRVSLSLSSGTGKPLRFAVLPGAQHVPRKGIKIPSFVELEDSRRAKGFFVELSIPMRKIAGWSATLPYLAGAIEFHDVDLPSDDKAQSVLGMKGKLHFSEAVATYKSFMQTTGLKNRDVRLDKLVDVDPGAGAERIIVGGKVMGVLSTSFTYMGLPIANPSDLISARVVDFDGGGRYAVLTELRQHGNGGSRDVLVVWFAKGDGSFQPALTVETRKQRGDASIQNTWALVSRGQHRGEPGRSKKRGKRGRKRAKAQLGFDLLFQVGEVAGFDKSNFREAPAPDAKGILLPWSEQQSAVYYLEGSIAYGGDAATDLPE
ncbi:MAG: hypothetical protein GY811_00935 [Myxococcales bacterium]|nr:hypothetical protein [Myxococcales bacterium]